MCSGQLETFAIVVIGMAAQCSTTMNGGTHPLSMHIYIYHMVYILYTILSAYFVRMFVRLCILLVYVFWTYTQIVQLQHICVPMNKPIGQSINQPANQSISLSIYVSVDACAYYASKNFCAFLH